MSNANQLAPEKKVHALFVGPSGSGKTCASVTVGDTEEKMSKVLVIDLDTRIKGILGLPELQEKIKAGKIEYEQPPKDKSVMDWLDNSLPNWKKRCNGIDIQTVILSSTTSLTEYAYQEIVNSNEVKHNKIKGKSMSQKQDYLYIGRVHRDFIVGELKELNCNLIIEAHLKDEGYNKDDEYILTGNKIIKLPGQLAAEVPAWFDETYEFSVEESPVNGQAPDRIVKFQGKLAKTTFPNLPTTLKWTNKNFFKLISGITSGRLDKNGNEVKK